MINIRLDNSMYLNCDKSYYISFPYDADILNIIKSFPERKFHSEDKSWEIPENIINEFKMIIDEYYENTEDIRFLIEEETTMFDDAIDEIEHIDVDDIYEYKTKPYQHQKESLQFGMDNDCFLLCDDQGLGKTKEIIDLMCLKNDLYSFKHVLIVCGINDLKWNWLKEIEIHSYQKGYVLGAREYKKGLNKGSLKTEINTNDKIFDIDNLDNIKEYFLITNIESFRDKIFVEKLKKAIINNQINAIVVDEIHKIKNPSSQQTKGLIQMKNCHTRIGLTGTPLVSKPMDAYIPLVWVGSEKREYFHFENAYTEKEAHKFFDTKKQKMSTYHEIIGYRNMDNFKKILQKSMLRRLKEDVLDLPDKIHIDEYVELSKKQQQIYNDILSTVDEKLIENIDKIELNSTMISKLIRLRQATTDTSLLSNKINESIKFDRAEEIIQECIDKNEKVVVFDMFAETLKTFKKRLKKYNPALVIGEQTNKNAEITKFRTNSSCKVILGSIGALGTGYTLVEANNVIFLNNPWTSSERAQAEDRCHRIGASKTVMFYTLIAKNTIDEKIDKLVKSKQRIADGIVDDKVKNRDFFDKKELCLK